jgi:hypothetical protein
MRGAAALAAVAALVAAACWGNGTHTSVPPPRPPSTHPNTAYVPPHRTPAQPQTDLELVLAKLETARDDMCACADAACAQQVLEDIMKWGEQYQKDNPDILATFDETDKARISEIVERLEACMSALNRGSSAMP